MKNVKKVVSILVLGAMLSSSHAALDVNAIVDESTAEYTKVSSMEEDIEALREENERLKVQISELNENNRKLHEYITSDIGYIMDINRDGVVDAMDASCILTYYAKSSVGESYLDIADFMNRTYGSSEGFH